MSFHFTLLAQGLCLSICTNSILPLEPKILVLFYHKACVSRQCVTSVLRTAGGEQTKSRAGARSKLGPRFISYEVKQTKRSAFNFSIWFIIELVWTVQKALFLWVRKNVFYWRLLRKLIELDIFSWIEL